MSDVIAFIGGGNMATSLIGGLIAAGHAPDSLHVAEPDATRAQALRDRLGVRVAGSAAEIVAGAGTLVLAVKPQQMGEALRGLKPDAGACVVSIAAGIRLDFLRAALGPALHYVRSMPNTPALYGCGISGLYAEPGIPESARQRAETVLRAAGQTVWLNHETELDAVTAVSGSGPAYFFLLVEAMREAGVALGLAPETAAQLAAHTCIGAARMIEGGTTDVAELRAQSLRRAAPRRPRSSIWKAPVCAPYSGKPWRQLRVARRSWATSSAAASSRPDPNPTQNQPALDQMGANASNALNYLVSTLLNLYLCAVILRIVLGWVRADFYNPVSQLVWKITQPVLGPFQKAIPRWRRLDTAATAYLIVLAVIYIYIAAWMFGIGVSTFAVPLFALLKIVVLAANLYTVALTFQAILSWFGPGVNNPASNILWSMNEPILRPIRRLIPPIAGLDLSPLFAIILMQVVVMLVPLPIFFRAGILG